MQDHDEEKASLEKSEKEYGNQQLRVGFHFSFCFIRKIPLRFCVNYFILFYADGLKQEAATINEV